MESRDHEALSELTILTRLFRLNGAALTPAAARYFLSLKFDRNDKRRMHALAVRNQADELTADEKEELFRYIRASDLLALLHSKSRIALKSEKSLAR